MRAALAVPLGFVILPGLALAVAAARGTFQDPLDTPALMRSNVAGRSLIAVAHAALPNPIDSTITGGAFTPDPPGFALVTETGDVVAVDASGQELRRVPVEHPMLLTGVLSPDPNDLVWSDWMALECNPCRLPVRCLSLGGRAHN